MALPLVSQSTSHFFSVDVEEYFHVSAFERYVDREAWDALPSRVVASTDQLLDVLAQHGATGTFFVLAWVAWRHRALIRRIADAGHEIASHGVSHRRVTTLAPAEFRADVRDSKALLEDLVGNEVRGFRAPSFSIVPSTAWAFNVLIEEGYRYDSSVFPIRRRGYGWPGAPTEPFVIRRDVGELLEIPMATTTFGALRVPAAGGGYLRHFPYGVIRRAFAEHTARGIPGMFYVHPWEIDPEQPVMEAPLLTRVRHYRGLSRTLPRIQSLLAEFPFTSVASQLSSGSLALCASSPEFAEARA